LAGYFDLPFAAGFLFGCSEASSYEEASLTCAFLLTFLALYLVGAGAAFFAGSGCFFVGLVCVSSSSSADDASLRFFFVDDVAVFLSPPRFLFDWLDACDDADCLLAACFLVSCFAMALGACFAGTLDCFATAVFAMVLLT
jgi:hypothetical protein